MLILSDKKRKDYWGRTEALPSVFTIPATSSWWIIGEKATNLALGFVEMRPSFDEAS